MKNKIDKIKWNKTCAVFKKGDRITIAGVGVGAKGQSVIDGINVKTKRKCKMVRLRIFTLGKKF